MLGIAVDELPVWLAESTERIQKDVAFVDSYSSGLEKSP